MQAMLDFEMDFLSDARDLAAAVRRLEAEDAVSLPLLGREACAALVAEAETRVTGWRPARPVVGEGEGTVHQDFELTVDLPQDGGFVALARSLDRHLAAALAGIDPPALDQPFHINDLILQRYPAGCAGITPHRDHIRYVGLVAIVVLAGAGRFRTDADRSGAHAREIPAPPGHMTLMRAPGLFGRRDRPFHLLTDVTAERYSFGLRHDARRERVSVLNS